MWLDVLLMVDTPLADAAQRRRLVSALERRGWEATPQHGFRASYTGVVRDELLVKDVEQDVKAAAYVAGITQFEAVCFVSDHASPPPIETAAFDDSEPNEDAE